MRRTMLALLVTVGLVVELAPAANAVTVRWTKRVGRAAVDVASAPDGSIYVVSTDPRSITVAATLHKYDAQGNLRCVFELAQTLAQFMKVRALTLKI